MKRWAGLLFALACVANLVVAGAWAVYMYAVSTPAQAQLATTHADMIGRWSGHSHRLEIRADATVSVNDGPTHYGGKIWRFHERDFSLWVFPMFPAHFHVEKPTASELDGDVLIVDGNHLRRERP